jgi:hypothetical protein
MEKFRANTIGILTLEILVLMVLQKLEANYYYYCRYYLILDLSHPRAYTYTMVKQ